MTPPERKIEELYELIEQMKVALFTTRRPDGRLVTRPMATQKRHPVADIWFVTDIETDKIDELGHDANVCLGYYDDGSKEWVSVSGEARISQDRALIRELHQPDWKAWFGDEGGERDGGPDDPRLALLLVDVVSAHYMKAKYGRPRMLFEVAKAMVTGSAPDVGREERVGGERFG